MNVLELRNISKQYDNSQVLYPLDLMVQSGQTKALLGPSGCGKSTLLRVIVGLIPPDTGEVYIHGELLTKQNMLKLRRRIGYLIQEGGLFPHLNLHANVTLMARYLSWPAERIAQRIACLSALTHLPAELLDRYPAQVSGGQRQRAALMRALFLDPDILLLDEPMGALDPIIRADLQTELRDIFQTLGKTVVLVTHDLSEAVFLAHEIVLLNKGHIVQQGTITDLNESPSDPFVTRFIHSQRPMSEAP